MLEFETAPPVGRSPWRRALRRFIRQPSGVIGASVVLVACSIALLAPLVAPHDPLTTIRGAELSPPSWEYLAGTDRIGRDVLSRIIFGLRSSLLVGFGATLIGASVGASTGLLAGFVGGRTGSWIMRGWEIVLSIPAVLLTLGLAAVVGAGPRTIAIGVGIWSAATFARVARSAALMLSSAGFIIAARSIGVKRSRIFAVYVFPNSINPLLVQAALTISAAILLESAFSFLGLGAQPPTPTLGGMLADASRVLRSAWWYGLFPGIALTLLVLGLNAAADAMRDALDPTGS